MTPKWLEWVRRLQATAQTGLYYANDPYDVERYEEMHALAIEIAAEHTGEDPSLIEALFRQDKGYTTPKIDVRGAAFQDGKILLVRERQDGLWTLPGGWADVDDRPSHAVEREIREESGFKTRAVKLLGVLDRDTQGHPPYPFTAYKLFFHCRIVGGEPQTSYETTAVDFFAVGELPPLSLPRVTPAQIVRLFEHYRDPTLPTDFD